jgi:hypothetical protein
MFVQYQLNRWNEFQDLDIPHPVPDLIPERPHNLCPRDIRGKMNPFAGSPTQVNQPETPVRILVQHHSEALQPLDHRRGLNDEPIDQLRDVLEMPPTLALHCCCLDPSLRHHGVGITVAKFVGDDDLYSAFVG